MTWHPPFQPPMPGLPTFLPAPGHVETEPDDIHQQGFDGISQNGDLLLQLLKSGAEQQQQQQQKHTEHRPESGYWQIHDPAVAALGPSHSFPMGLPPGIDAPQQRPVYIPRFPHFQQQQQQEQLFPTPGENPFLTPTDHGFPHPFAIPVERPFHPRVPYPFQGHAPYPIDGYHPFVGPPTGTVVQRSTTPVQQQQHTGQQNMDVKKLPDTKWQPRQNSSEGSPWSKSSGGTPKKEVLQEPHPMQQFYGNGAELLQLLQGGAARAKAAAALKGEILAAENGEFTGDSSTKSSQRGSPSTAHGPIGPPKRHAQSPPPSPNELLGRFWAALPPSNQSPYNSDIAAGNLKPDFSSDRARQGDSAIGFSLLKRGSPKLPLDGFEESRMSDQKSNLKDGYFSSRIGNGEGEMEAGKDDARRRKGSSSSSGSSSMRRGRNSAGQWVERQRDGDEYGEENKEEGGKSVNGVHSKARDELRRKRRQQQEWRMKSSSSPQPDSKSETRKAGFQRMRPLASQLEHPGLPCGISAVGSSLDGDLDAAGGGVVEDIVLEHSNGEQLTKEEELTAACLRVLDLDDSKNANDTNAYQNKQQLQRHDRLSSANRKDFRYRVDMEKLTIQLLALYSDLIPTDEEEMRRRKFLSQLDSLVGREWPGARLFLFGSCANAFGVCNSDIDVCLSVDDEEPSKADLVRKMASILDSDTMTNVQALTHARVPIVKFTDPVTGISCDICVNNMLAVVNSKLLHDYAQIDIRLRQLAFLIKHWAKRRQVNETYRGTLSSYAYVLMCIHFLQQRRPAILPCLQEMQATYRVKVGKVECAYFDRVESLQDFGSENRESVGELLCCFFEYWAYQHDYTHSVISVRTGGFLRKDEKEWTRRIGNERHLICIEDPFETSHDLGRVVDKYSINVLRDEFYRAAQILKKDPNPSLTLFQPYLRH